jgi:hypothetical protein
MIQGDFLSRAKSVERDLVLASESTNYKRVRIHCVLNVHPSPKLDIEPFSCTETQNGVKQSYRIQEPIGDAGVVARVWPILQLRKAVFPPPYACVAFGLIATYPDKPLLGC